MRADITTIPVAEVFERRDGCPICRMRDILEDRVTEYITGAAMMEPDVRIETNREGFCHPHFQKMLAKRNRLSVALILESHLVQVERDVFAGLPLVGKKPASQGRSAEKSAGTCFVCDKIDWAMERQLATVCRLYAEQREFRQLFAEQPSFCLPHLSELTALAGGMDKRYGPEMAAAAARISRMYLQSLAGDVTHFTKMFDYRNSGPDADWGNSRDAIERAVGYLTGRDAL